MSPILLTALQAIFILLTCGRIYREKLQMQLFSRQIEKSIISLSIDHYVCNHSKMHFCAIKKRLYNIFLIGFFAILFLDQFYDHLNRGLLQLLILFILYITREKSKSGLQKISVCITINANVCSTSNFI